ncbi:Uncharacterised protein [Mycobacteroides abscessus subsp. massiliense]|nr:Uncharacterised protein [Mycobacteroides abscessus subsp. massiliense]
MLAEGVRRIVPCVADSQHIVDLGDVPDVHRCLQHGAVDRQLGDIDRLVFARAPTIGLTAREAAGFFVGAEDRHTLINQGVPARVIPERLRVGCHVGRTVVARHRGQHDAPTVRPIGVQGEGGALPLHIGQPDAHHPLSFPLTEHEAVDGRRLHVGRRVCGGGGRGQDTQRHRQCPHHRSHTFPLRFLCIEL